jgi:phytoene dehydrogenase-like protein
MAEASDVDVVVVGAGHNGLVASVLLARAGLLLVLEEKSEVGGAAKTERPFKKAPELGTSTGAYLLGVMPPELLTKLGLKLTLLRRDPHYFLPTTEKRYLLFGSDAKATQSHSKPSSPRPTGKRTSACRKKFDSSGTTSRPPGSPSRSAWRRRRSATSGRRCGTPSSRSAGSRWGSTWTASASRATC